MKQFFVILLSLAFAQHINAQKGFDILHDFCSDANYSAGAVMSVYADTNAFIVFGQNKTNGVSDKHGYIASFDYTGQVNWTKNLYFPGKVNGASSYNSIVKIEENKYAVIGVISDYDLVPNRVVLHPYHFLFHSNGDSILYKSYVDTLSQDYSDILYDGTNIITVGASITSYNPYTAALLVSKHDITGNLLWKRNYLEKFNTVPKDVNIIVSADKNHYLLIGGMYDSTINSFGSAMMKMDTSGNVILMKSLPKKYPSHAQTDVVSDRSGGYYFASSYSTLPFNSDVQGSQLYYGKLDENGDTLWTKLFIGHYGQIKGGYQIRWSNDSAHLILHAKGYNDNVSLLIKIDTSGNMLWHRMIQHYFNFSEYPWQAGPQELFCMEVTPDGRYLMGGYAAAKTEPGNRAWLSLSDSDGCRYPNDPACWPVSVNNIQNATAEIKIYPNPVTDKLIIEKAEAGSAIRIFDIVGRKVYNSIITSAKQEVDLSHIGKGNYVVQLISPQGDREIRRILKE